MNILKLQIVVLIEKYKKVTDVAAELGLKQPTVSFHMKSLENELGTPLFQSRSGRVLLTEAGYALHQYAVRIVALASEAERTVKQTVSRSRIKLSIGASAVSASYLLPAALSGLTAQYPETETTVAVADNRVLRERLRGRQLELAVLHGYEQADESLRITRFADDEAVLIFAPGHPFAAKDHIRPETISREPWIQHAPGSALRELADRWTQLNGARLWNRAETDSAEAVKQWVIQGNALAVFSRIGIAAELEAGSLEYRPLPGIMPERAGFYLAWRKDHALTEIQQALADRLIH
ncbi:DNA-binding transcriptional LysR family regulator [Paenibacillus forsythiae]|uniref:DNA-binding transcriptional LysR family regulator n=1 Tax=Paenibacillus forsythiae TaxID=365616 RepID=A0ABU3H691_9BACL|nr:LysR family transcriptional regulator [Paenibacillus forsythiae]MDT3426329.1 DNA-binding transcriptional LysR family regulator [Paenibacillus forsythiae]